MIAKCKCKNAQQDGLHGEGNRVFNPLKKQTNSPQVYRCSICGHEREADTVAKKK